MPINRLAEFSLSAGSNTDIAGVNVAEGMQRNLVNNAIRALTAMLKSDLQSVTPTMTAASTFTLASISTGDWVLMAPYAGVSITSFGATVQGMHKWIEATGESILRHSANLDIQGNADVTLTAGDVVYARARDATNWKAVVFKDSGLAMPDVASLTAEVTVDDENDFFPFYDASAAATRKVLPKNIPSKGMKNDIINGCFRINQRAAATNADDTYAHDRWYALTQTGTIAVSTLTDVEDGLPRMARLTQSQAVAQRMGYAQIIEGVNCKKYRGKTVTFRFGRERLSASANIRIAVLEWTGTEDSVTSDVVLDWTSATYTAGNFFLAANLTVSSVVQQALTANTLTDGSAVTVTLGSSFNNLIVFAWTEGTVAQNVTLDLGRAQIEIGSSATQFEHRPIGLEQSLCDRYLPCLTATATSQSFGVIGQCISTTQAVFQIPLRERARAAITGITTSGATHYLVSNASGTTIASTACAHNSGGSDSVGIIVTVAAGLTAGNASLLLSNNIAAQIQFTGAEL